MSGGTVDRSNSCKNALDPTLNQQQLAQNHDAGVGLLSRGERGIFLRNGLQPQNRPINYLADSSSKLYREVSQIATELYRVVVYETNDGHVEFLDGDIK